MKWCVYKYSLVALSTFNVSLPLIYLFSLLYGEIKSDRENDMNGTKAKENSVIFSIIGSLFHIINYLLQSSLVFLSIIFMMLVFSDPYIFFSNILRE